MGTTTEILNSESPSIQQTIRHYHMAVDMRRANSRLAIALVQTLGVYYSGVNTGSPWGTADIP